MLKSTLASSSNLKVKGRCASNFKLKRIGFNSNMLELFVWILLLSLVLYIYLPELLGAFFNSPESLNKTTGNSIHEDTIRRKSKEYRLDLAMQVIIGSGSGGDDDILQVLADASNSNHEISQLIIPQEFRNSHDGSTSNIDKESIAKNELQRPMDKHSCQIKCTAPFPIEFVYEGNGMPTFGKIIVEKRKVKLWDGMFVYFYVAILDFEKSKLVEMDTGRYICRSIGETRPQTLELLNINGTLKRRVAIEIFVPGEMKLIHRDISPTTIISHDIALDGNKITIPCGVTDPTTKVSLYLMDKKKTYLEVASNDELVVYDNIDGFRVPVGLVRNLPEINLICKAHHGEIDRVIPFKIKLKELNSHISPTSSRVTLHPDQLPIQVFKCEAMEPLTVKWLNGPPTHVAHGVSIVNSGLYSASFIATPTQFSGDSTVAKFECLRQRDGMVIHTWEWTMTEGATKPHLTYNEKRKELSCCMKDFASRLIVEFCSTMLECRLKASLRPQMESLARKRSGQTGEPPSKNGDNNNGCAVWTLPNEFQAGLIMCIQVRDNSFNDHSRNRELPPVFFRWNDDVVFIRDGFYSKPLNHLVSMQVTTGADTHREGNSEKHTKVKCTASSILFAKGFRWTLFSVDDVVFEDIQLKSKWGRLFGSTGVVSYQEEYNSSTASYYGVLYIKNTRVKKPLLKINSKEDGFAHLELTDNYIAKITCEASLWNDTNVWIESFVNNITLI